MKVVLLLMPVEEGALCDHLIANDSQLGEQVLVTLLEHHVVVDVLDLVFEEAEYSFNDNGENLILEQVLLILKALDGPDANDVPHHLQVL